MKLEQKAEPLELILPRKAVQEIIKLLGDTDDEVSFELTPTRCVSASATSN